MKSQPLYFRQKTMRFDFLSNAPKQFTRDDHEFLEKFIDENGGGIIAMHFITFRPMGELTV